MLCFTAEGARILSRMIIWFLLLWWRGGREGGGGTVNALPTCALVTLSGHLPLSASAGNSFTTS